MASSGAARRAMGFGKPSLGPGQDRPKENGAQGDQSPPPTAGASPKSGRDPQYEPAQKEDPARCHGTTQAGEGGGVSHYYLDRPPFA